MVPLQLQNTYQYCKKIKTIIVGGASVPSGFLTEIKALKSKIYGTYGMTETITHIAVKPLNDAAVKKDKNFEDVNSYYKALPNVRISQDERDCLVLEVPYLFDGTLITNDIVSIQSEDTFELLGRYDNVINSGGIKFHPEKIQDKLSTRIDNRFFITSEKDADLGEKIVLILEAESNTLNNSCFDELDKYEMPKAIYAIPKFVETKTGKIDQAKTLELLK
jgi:O-succinylbenzoic acid--CoA ligase